MRTMTIEEMIGTGPAAEAARAPMHTSVAAQLREMILTGELAPGARLNERVLCERLNVSRTPLREAFRVLAAERLIVQHAHRGATVVALSAQDIRHLFEVMMSLEGLSGSLAAQRASDAQIAEIRALHFEMLAAHAREDLPAYYRLNHRIHAAINQAAGNPALTETYNAINGRIQHFRFRSNFNRDKWNNAVEQHSEMIDALERRDSEALKAVLERHLLDKRDVVLETMTEAALEVNA